MTIYHAHRPGWSSRRRSLALEAVRAAGRAIALVFVLVGFLAWIVDLWLLMPAPR